MRLATVLAAGLLVAGGAPAVAHNPTSRTPGATHFGVEVRVTPQLGSGESPQISVDRYGNLFVAAGKGEPPAPVAVNMGASVPVRALPWLRYSGDGGRSWNDISTMPRGLDTLAPSIVADVTPDESGRTYFLAGSPGAAVVATFTAEGRGDVRWEATANIPGWVGGGSRPWIIARDEGKIVVFDDTGTAAGGSRYLVRVSSDRGGTFAPVPATLPGSDQCRAAADHSRDSNWVYAACTDGAGQLYAYASKDGGILFDRYPIGRYNAADTTQSPPAIAVGPTGIVWVLYVDGEKLGPGGVPTANRLKLFRSADHGRTWRFQDITPAAGRYRHASLAASPDGRLGMSVYRPVSDPAERWYIQAAIFKAGHKPWLINFASHTPASDDTEDGPPSGPLSVAFGRDRLMSVVWLHTEERIPELDRTPVREVWFCQTLPSSGT